MLDLVTARRQMIEQQVRAWEVLDLKVLDALGQVPREEYVPAAYREIAFADTAVPLAHGQCMLSPKVEGRILQSLEIQPHDHALEVGTGTGFTLTDCTATGGAATVAGRPFATVWAFGRA